MRSLLVSFPFKLLLLFSVSVDSQHHSWQCEWRVLTMAAVIVIDFFGSAAEAEKKKEDFYQPSEMQS